VIALKLAFYFQYCEGLRKRGRKRDDDRTNEDGSKKLKRSDLTELEPLVAMILLAPFFTHVILAS
jgi:hypothetical protein